jgi:hypothetical protein
MACSSIKCEEFIFSKLHIQGIVLVAMVTAVMFVQPIPIFDKTGLNPYVSLIISTKFSRLIIKLTFH